MPSRKEQLRQKAEEFARRRAAASSDEERVDLLTVAQAYSELADVKVAKGTARRRRKAIC